ncbi:unnamed protein product, partial [Ectocarpus sp. 4 AP-2014]
RILSASANQPQSDGNSQHGAHLARSCTQLRSRRSSPLCGVLRITRDALLCALCFGQVQQRSKFSQAGSFGRHPVHPCGA